MYIRVISTQDMNSISTCILQLCSAEDITPKSLETENYIACLIGDGHSGKGCTTIIDTNAELILSTMVKGKSVEIGMDMCQDLCQNEESGAMIALTLYNKNTRLLEIISAGDISVNAYKDGQIIHQQPIHDCQTIGNDETGMKLLHENGILRCNSSLQMIPNKDGISMCLRKRLSYFNWAGTQKIIATCSFVGHRGMSRLPAFTRSLTLPKQCHIVMTSDGVSDMIHPEDRMLSYSGTTASEITEAARKRWIEPHFNELPSQYKCYNVKGYFRPNVKDSSFTIGKKTIKLQTENTDGSVFVQFFDGSSRIVQKTEIVEHNYGADDISCLVMKCQ